MPNLYIENVDFDLLEKQRKALAVLLAKQDSPGELEGLLLMLESWSNKKKNLYSPPLDKL